MFSFLLELNECTLNTDLCEQVCNNTAGSYQCSCYTGYHLESNSYNCSGKQYKYSTVGYVQIMNIL